MNTPKLAGFLDEFEKIAIPRYERAIQEGAISRGQVAKDVPGWMPAAWQRRLTRQQMALPAEVPAAELARRRQLSEKILQSRSRNMVVNNQMVRDPLPATRGNIVYMPEDPARALRSLSSRGPVQQIQNTAATFSKGRIPFSRSVSMPQDPTLSNAVLQHELGEVRDIGLGSSSPVTPFATHMGVSPIVQENLALRGDPEAIKEMAKFRSLHPEDAAVQRMVSRVGGTPDSPIPLGGKQQRAVTRMIQKAGPAELSAATRGKMLALEMSGMKPSMLPTTVGSSLATLQRDISPIVRAFKTKNLGAGVRGVGRVLRPFGRVAKFFATGA